MVRKTSNHEFAPVLDAARKWIRNCLVEDDSVCGDESLLLRFKFPGAWSEATPTAVRPLVP